MRSLSIRGHTQGPPVIERRFVHCPHIDGSGRLGGAPALVFFIGIGQKNSIVVYKEYIKKPKMIKKRIQNAPGPTQKQEKTPTKHNHSIYTATSLQKIYQLFSHCQPKSKESE